MKISPLPSLKSLVAFESAARHLSFTAAGAELNVTQGAVSRQIRQLEVFLGKALFTRINPNIHLTPTGAQYYQTVKRSLEDVASATGDILQWQGGRQLTVATTYAMASLWLLPRIASFKKRYENLDIRILASDASQDFKYPEFDIGMFYVRSTPSNMKVTSLFEEEVFPVCSRGYLDNHMGIKKIDELSKSTLLYLDNLPSEWINWPEWFQRVGIKPCDPKARININNYPMLIQAAIGGQGIALAWRHLVDDHLNSGELVRPIDTVLKTKAQFCLLEPEENRHIKDNVALFRNWVLEELKQSPN
ncbi:LysR substrate-binding domain-containing protein [Kiloniella antarctica]|uniref:LysR substrate-binding domain-containing protein n=1 Tax=Kiloniella antarctica TaxID=1550907 RepID=A0ABW5BNC7_9PROT